MTKRLALLVLSLAVLSLWACAKKSEETASTTPPPEERPKFEVSDTVTAQVHVLSIDKTSRLATVQRAAGDTVTVNLQDTTAATLGVNTVDVSTSTGANTALTAIDTAINSVSTNRGALGAVQNRLGSVISSISNTRENLSAAESRIRDVDVAAETADLTRNSILQQAAVSVLAQANVQPQLALSLL